MVQCAHRARNVQPSLARADLQKAAEPAPLETGSAVGQNGRPAMGRPPRQLQSLELRRMLEPHGGTVVDLFEDLATDFWGVFA